jgi:uncharacterized protein YxeA
LEDIQLKKILGILLIIVIAVVAVFGYKYYDNTYKSETVYAVVPNEVPTKEQTKDNSGKIVADSYSYEYTLTFVHEDGTKQVMEYELAGDNPTPLTQNSFVTAKISKTRITEGPNPVDQSKIPEKVLAVLTK